MAEEPCARPTKCMDIRIEICVKYRSCNFLYEMWLYTVMLLRALDTIVGAKGAVEFATALIKELNNAQAGVDMDHRVWISFLLMYVLSLKVL